ncbi:hypothetical protein [Salibacterium lacus]|uniref:Phage protein n=1 Tax=Salibacterium lacus TaxID=1898109 RepID=A0ABW5T0H9_9BACI
MKKVIDGKLFDTKKAEKITGFSRERVVREIHCVHWRWTDGVLYRTKNGIWFEVVDTFYVSDPPDWHVLDEHEVRKLLLNVNPDKFIEWFEDIEEA